jgi:hypothetical protein
MLWRQIEDKWGWFTNSARPHWTMLTRADGESRQARIDRLVARINMTYSVPEPQPGSEPPNSSQATKSPAGELVD